MLAATSLLFVPGSRPDRFAKARAAGAGVTVIDLEDAVADGDKESAREAAVEAVGEDGDHFAVRINAVATAAGIADLGMLVGADRLPGMLLIPMAEHARDLEIVAGALGERCPLLVPLIETPRGLRNALDIARAPKVAAVMFGGGDFAAELGVKLAWEPLLVARQQLLLACAEALVPAIDVPFVRLEDEDALAEECARSKALGFAAKAAIHPAQVPAIDKAFAPSEKEINEAAEALRAYDEGGQQAIRHNGRMLEAPLVKHYRAVLARSKDIVNA
ncbi:(3S)-malyl-CoA thioesterase [Tsuneonella dongtanensis]|uniref:(3S)-malyl-CoA thioesterase n=1 Tax=Tsuneonella dongtanensis TaxID=692370 RepID=A0A1B2AG48_9SPHN|nr:CoA ester lyase [Tsuneonella dongtanensis]ANY21101.1 (3S)-malyl-CoA thioesterase [Tsuneonella dongtanensis]